MITNSVNLSTNTSVNRLKDVHETNTIKTKVSRCKHGWNLKPIVILLHAILFDRKKEI